MYVIEATADELELAQEILAEWNDNYIQDSGGPNEDIVSLLEEIAATLKQGEEAQV